MSLTITSEPNELGTGVKTSSPYRPTFVDVSSDTATIVRVIADVLIEGVLQATVEKEPVLGTVDNFRIEVGEINKKYLESEFKTTSSFLEVHENTISANLFTIIMYEVTESGGILSTTWAEEGAGSGGLTTSQIFQFNGVNNHLQDMDDRRADGVTKKFLTNRPQNSQILNDIVYHCGVLPDVEGFDTVIVVEEFDGINGSGSSLLSTTSSNLSVSRRKASYTIDPTQLNALTKSIVYHIEDTANNPITEDFTVNVVEDCGDVVNLLWMNHWSETDQYFFSGNQTQKTKTKVKSITNRLEFSFASTDRGRRDIKRTNVREFEIFTKTTRPEVVEWLAEIGESIDVFIMIGSDRVPINVKSVTSEISNDEDPVFQISIKYNLANERISQLG